MRVSVIGAGSWGTAVANLVGAKQPVTLWARRSELTTAINERRENPDYLPGYPLAPNITASSDLAETIAATEAVVMGVPSHGYRAVLESLRDQLGSDTPIISLAKGVERESLMRMTEVTADVLPDHNPDRIGVLTGPNLAKEIAAGQPAATVIAMKDGAAAAALQQVFMSSRFRVYTNDDVVGSESAGALKNVMAIAAGMAHGLGFGDNTMATLITRALAELTRLGVAMGGRPLTFAGLAGMGDLIATCMSSQSRNHTVGYGLGQGKKLDDIIDEMNQVAEGVKSTPGILALADRHGIEMPIATQVARVLYEGAEPLEAVSNLMAREAKPEMHGIA
ncbi:MAG: NAD(P)H-dependent glycerol-3-phosphate dehydrogenase [Acidimicrobiia bacterium]|nr:NAD(P)H-dependent glycerol-3-phosphate dehydrogenase [Acidimicrobiia bacterium]